MENSKNTTDKFISALKGFATNLEELQVQFALGKAEAKDKFNEYQGKIKNAIHEAKTDLKTGTGTLGEFKNKLEHLEVQLALGKAEAKELIEDQSKKVKQAIHELEHLVSKL